MDGVALADWPAILGLLALFAVLAVLILWLPNRLPYVRSQGLVIWSLFVCFAVAGVVSRLFDTVPFRLSDLGLLAAALFFLVHTWRRRNTY